MSYSIEQRLASKNGWFTPAESRSYYGRYDRHGITWHWWGDGTGASNHDNIVNYMLAGAQNGQKSVNYVLSDNKITLVVGPDNVAWTSQSGNATTVSCELQPTLQGEGYKKAGWLASELASRYGGDRAYYPHKYWYSTACPGTISLDRIRQEEDKWQRGEYNAAPAPNPAPTPPPTPSWNFVPRVGKAKVTGTGVDGLWVMKSPQLSGQTVAVVNESTMMDFVGYVDNGDSVEGDRRWWRNQYGNYFSARYAPEYVPPAPNPAPTPPPAPAPIVPIIVPVTERTMYTLANAKLLNIENMTVVGNPYALDTPMLIAGESTWKGNKFYLTKSSVDGKRLTGLLVGDLKAVVTPPTPPAPVEPDWVKNLRDIDDTNFWFKEDCQLWDIANDKPSTGNFAKTFKKDDKITMGAVTVAHGREWRLTQYSHDKRFYNGIDVDKLTLTPPGVPDIPPVPIEPPEIASMEKIMEMLKKIIAHFGIK